MTFLVTRRICGTSSRIILWWVYPHRSPHVGIVVSTMPGVLWSSRCRTLPAGAEGIDVAGAGGCSEPRNQHSRHGPNQGRVEKVGQKLWLW